MISVNHDALSNFNRMGIYWWSRFQWVQFPILIMHRLDKQVIENINRLQTLIQYQEKQTLNKNLNNYQTVDIETRRNGISIARPNRDTSKRKSSTSIKTSRTTTKRNHESGTLRTTSPLRKSRSIQKKNTTSFTKSKSTNALNTSSKTT